MICQTRILMRCKSINSINKKMKDLENVMNRMIYYVGIVIVLLFYIGYFVCRFVFNSDFYGMCPSDFLIIGILLNLILIVWKTIKDKK